LYEFSYPSGRVARYVLEPFKGRATEVSPDAVVNERIRMRFPAIVFRDAVMLNMFDQATISKRCAFRTADSAATRELWQFLGMHTKLEFEAYPVRARYLRRLLGAYLWRWREVPVYVLAAWRLALKREPIYLVEEHILRDT
ncbi:MAG: hypothetical protein L0Y66_21275, partial [Myxococcaceae bacterium]|nr:hypothetical protein [Myxococcaceae bacterium]